MKTRRFATSDFPLSFETHRWAEETYDRFPMLRWPSGSVCEPATIYFGWCLQYRRNFVISSLEPEAYVIREWLTYIANKGIHFDQVDDLVLRGFREAHALELKAETIHIHQVERKLATIYLLYRALDEVLAVSSSGKPRKLLVAPDENARNYPLTTASYAKKDGTIRYVWSGSKIVPTKGTKRPTPGVQSVDALLSWIRSKPERLDASGIIPTARDYLLADRDWLMARAMALVGMRRSEVARLCFAEILQMLRDENIVVPKTTAGLISCTPDEQARILRDLENLNANDPYTQMPITGKGRKGRYAILPVRFVIDLLKIWIWGGRKILLDRSLKSPDEVFLSSTNSEPLNPKSISHIMDEAFAGSKTAGSAHRLRAHYCTVTAIRLWEDEMSRNGFNFSQAVYNIVLDRLADAMGHSSVTTTVRYYLDLAVAKYFGFSSRAKYIVFSAIWKTVGDAFSTLSASDIRGIVKIIKVFSKPNTERLKEVIALALANSQLNPDIQSNVEKVPEKLPRIRLAFDRDKVPIRK